MTEKCKEYEEEWTWQVLLVAFGGAALIGGLLFIVICACGKCGKGKTGTLTTSNANLVETREMGQRDPYETPQGQDVPVYAQVNKTKAAQSASGTPQINGTNGTESRGSTSPYENVTAAVRTEMDEGYGAPQIDAQNNPHDTYANAM